MTASFCPAGSNGVVEPLLQQVDCQIAYYVEQTYASLFGPFGFFEPVLTGALTLYVAFYGFQLMTGRGSVSLSGLAPKIFAIGVVLAFATRWSAYQVFFFDLLYGGADQLAALLVDRNNLGGAPSADGVIGHLDRVIKDLTVLASSWNDGQFAQANGAPPAPSMNDLNAGQASQSDLPPSPGVVNLLWLSAIGLSLSTVGVLIIAKILLGLLLAIGPLMLVMALFSATRGLFEGWLKTLMLYVLVSVFTMALTGGVLHVVAPIVDGIKQAQILGSTNTQSVFVLAMAVFIFALLIFQVFRMCAHLTSTWTLGFSHRAEKPAATGQASALSSSDPVTTSNGRVADMVVAIERDASQGQNGARTRSLSDQSVALARPQQSAPTLTSRRVGQRLRTFGDRSQLKGRLA